MVDIVRTKEYLLDNVFQDGQSPGSITAQDMRDFVVTAPYLANHGWQFYYDNQYSQGVPRVIAANTPTQITINGGQETVGHPPGLPAFWNTSTNKVVPNGLNNFGILRLSFRGFYSGGGTSSLFDVTLDAGGAAGIIWEESGVFLKGSGQAQTFNYIIPLFAGPDFVANGGIFRITSYSNPCSCWQFALTATQIYSANPNIP